MRTRIEYRVERWWGQWCVADYPASKLNSDSIPYPVSTHRFMWMAWRKAKRLAKINSGDAVIRQRYYTWEEQGYG